MLLFRRSYVVDWPPVPTRLPALAECVVLAALLHLLLVALFGSVTGGTARPGEGVWGAIDIRLAGRGEPRPATLEPAPPPRPDAGPPRAAAEPPRWGGQVRDADVPPPADNPGAARLGQLQAVPLPGAPEASLPLPAVPRAPALERLAAPVPAPAPLAEPLPAAAPDPTPPRERAPEPLPPRETAPPPAPEPAPPVELRQLMPPPGAAPATSTAPLQRVTPVDRFSLPPVAPPLQPLPPPVPPAVPAPVPQQVPLAPSPQGLPQARPTEPAGVPTTPEPARPALAAPDAGPLLGHDVATPPAAPASGPRLNLDYVRPRGGPISPLGSRGAVNLLPVPPEVKSKLGEDIQKSARPDCRTAYANQGLVGAVPLVADALRKDGCRW